MANIRPFIIALAFGLIAVVLVYLYIQKVQKDAVSQEIEMARIVRATANIDPGVTVKEHMIEEIEVPAALVSVETVTEMDEIIGQVSITAIYESQTLMNQMFERETALEVLSRRLGAGWRAVTVGVSEISGIGGNIKTGDHVDVLVTILNHDEVGVSSTFTVLRNIDVMAVGRDIGFDDLDDNGGAISKSVTLKVNPEEAELLTLASEVGSVRLALRDPDDEFAPFTDGTSLTEFVTYTMTRDDLEERAQREREEREAAETAAREAAIAAAMRSAGYDVGPDVYDDEGLTLLPPVGPPPILIEVILGGVSQTVELERK